MTNAEIVWEHNAGYQYVIESSLNNTNWTVVADHSTNLTQSKTTSDDFSSAGRYFRVVVTGMPGKSQRASFLNSGPSAQPMGNATSIREKMEESVIVRLMTERKLTLALAESCTGGFIANRITDVPGASRIFRGGMVAYSNDVKKKFLGVRAEILERNGAVSEAVAWEMAEGARRKFGADFAIAVTGIAGPGGGTRRQAGGDGVYFTGRKVGNCG